MKNSPRIMILGVGCKLLTDEGFGIHVIEALDARHTFPDNVSIVDGGVLGLNLLGVISETDRLIVIDVIRNNGAPGTLCRIDHDDIPNRFRAKNSLHQIDFLEAMTVCRTVLDREPQTVILGVEPADVETCSVELTPVIRAKTEEMIRLILSELESLGVTWAEKGAVSENVSCNSL
ncbi:HyaD/HybD family hydrogenase maturation endopept idase [Desulfonema ishimotonii]|uniref:HyaD/HybD family hydrogenase maturation endopept idase n=1 Tax=Desulfonema ishimotonii TaxID=45657 RepID=A0A401FW57_9BACT|nr:HyaD/HybD family hydrogenase maturation endopeptidase [Desulfonema ishimotonii]GBC61183.1 HyaD/HybD family hydrogenase maturation endopept idase [Desulfonema ishimotonii]